MTAPENTQVAVASKAAVSTFDLSPRNFDEALRLADYLAKSEMVPNSYRGKPGDCLIAIQWGAEVGLKPLQALQSIAAINGKPNLYGDAGKALLLANGCVIEEDDMHVVKANSRARCKITRAGRPPVERTFSLDDAQTAGLWNKAGPWKLYPYRQMAWRAFWFAARDAAADLLRGMGGFEEGLDMPAERHMGPVDEVGAPPAPAPKPALPLCKAEDFEADFPKFERVVRSGKKTASQLLATLKTKASFTPEQEARILSLKPDAEDATPAATPSAAPAPATGEHDDFVGDMEAAEAAQGAAQ